MTIPEKILAAHTGKEQVQPGEFIEARVDLALGNDITAPLAIAALRERKSLSRRRSCGTSRRCII